jgi:amino acid adenylation domain-containing protein
MLERVLSSDSCAIGFRAHSLNNEVMTIRELIDRMARTQPDASFLISPETGRVLTFRGLQEQASVLSTQLRQAGLEPGDKVAFLMDNGLFAAQLFLGAMYGGLVSVPLNVRAGVSQLSYVLDHCDAKVVFVGDEYATLIEEVMAQARRTLQVIPADIDSISAACAAPPVPMLPTIPAPEDPALLMYTSGSTGQPKAAVHSHRTLLAHGRNSVTSHQLSSADRSLLVLPLYHINAECVTLIPTLLSGGSVVVPHRFSVSQFWDWLDEHRCTWSALVPTIISQLLDWQDPRADNRGAAFQRIRFLRSSSAPLAPSLHREFLDKFNLLLIQAMGSSEAGNIFSNPLPPRENKIGSTGLPWGFETKIVNGEGVEVPQGEPGEVLIRGAALTQGYYKEPEATAAVFDSDRWLHTGDLAYRDKDGYFFMVGRSKELIIKGGVNIAPRQIDDVLESHPAVLEAAAVGVPDHHLGEDLVAFVVLRAGIAADERELLTFCERRLGHFKTPTRIHFAPDLPKGPSGKVQRLRLLEEATKPGTSGSASAQNGFAVARGNGQVTHDRFSALPSSIEQTIADIWAELLKVPRVGVHDNFFTLGGDSLLAIQCLSRLRDKLPARLTLSEFFEKGTIAQQAALVRERLYPAGRIDGQSTTEKSAAREDTQLQRLAPPAGSDTIPLRDRALPSRLSPLQERIWFMEQLNPGLPVYNESEAVRLCGELNVDALERALNVVIARHETLRTTIQTTDGQPVGIVHENWPLRLKQIDLSGLTARQREAEVERLLIAEPRVAYRLQDEPAIRAALIRLCPSEHVFILMMHHLICDWSSEGVLWRELAALYRSFCRGESLVLPPLPIQHGDYAVWQRQQLTEASLAEDLAFWVENLRGAPALLELPSDRPRPLVMSYRGARRRFRLNRTLTEALRHFSRREKTSLFTLFTAALKTLLHRYTGSGDIPVGIPIAERDRPELQSMIGFMLHTHVLRTELSGDMTFCELVARVQQGALKLYEHRSVPFDQVVRAVQPERNLSYSPLFQVMLNWRDRDQDLSFIGLEGLGVESLLAESRTSKFDLTLILTDMGDEISVEMEYSTDLFDEVSMVRMFGHYQTLLEGVAVDPERRLSELPLLTEAERHQLLVEWNDTKVDYPADACLHELFETQAKKIPEAVAVEFEGSQLCYRELNERANQLAHYLRGMGVGPDTLVGVAMERSLEMVIALYGVLKAGGAYVPIDPEYPQERVAFMLQDANVAVLLTQARLAGLLPSHKGRVVCVDGEWEQIARQDATNPGWEMEPSHLAYMIYTSGSTGRPKGAMNTHRGICNRLLWMQDQYGLTEADKVLQKTPFSFDVSVWEFFWPLLVGARLVVAEPGGHRDPAYLVKLIKEQGITVLHFVPSMLRAFLEEPGVERCQSLRHVICSGEALPYELQERFFELLAAQLHNLYGPTEAAVDVTHWTCRCHDERKIVPIGRPVANTQVYMLDRYLQPVPMGVPGELHLGGVQVGRGYHKRPELTAEKFIPDPFSGDPQARLYKTGDLCRWLPDGVIEYLGRMDFQVKIRGFRIELGEVEDTLRQHPAVHEAVVMAREDTPGDKRLVAYVVLAGEPGCTTAELRDYLKQKLPRHMVPVAWVSLSALPLTPNGKVDRKALPLPGADAVAELSTVYVAPDSETEQKIAAIWQDVLGIAQVGRTNNFFDLGGDSLRLMRVHSRLQQAFDKDITMVDMFRCTTVRALAHHLAGQSDSSVSDRAQAQGEVRKDAIRRHRRLRRHLANELPMESSEHEPRN